MEEAVRLSSKSYPKDPGFWLSDQPVFKPEDRGGSDPEYILQVVEWNELSWSQHN